MPIVKHFKFVYPFVLLLTLILIAWPAQAQTATPAVVITPDTARTPAALQTQEALLLPTANVIRTEIALTATAFPLTPQQTDDALGVAFLFGIGSMLFVLALIGVGFWLSSRPKRDV